MAISPLDPTDNEIIDVALSLCELLEDFDRLEAVLLGASSRDLKVTASQLAASTGTDDQTAGDVLLQLRRAEAVGVVTDEHGRYAVMADQLRSVLALARLANRILRGHESRQPPQDQVTPLVTFPVDPTFADTIPQEFEMDWLMPTLIQMIQQAESRIVILTPFLEHEGLDRIADGLGHALDDGIEVVVVTRYLHDPDSHNRSVLIDFLELLTSDGTKTETLSLVDYTIWPEGVDPSDRDQNGVNPAFTLHSKLVLVDERTVYVGSANVTDYGFSQYLETGVQLEGPVVTGYKRLVDKLLDSDGATTWQPSIL